MKNLKLLALFGIGIFALLSFNYFPETNEVKDGTYNAYFYLSNRSVTSKRTLNNCFSNPIKLNENVLVYVKNNTIRRITPFKYNEILNKPLSIQKNGDATAEVMIFDQDFGDNEMLGVQYHYYLIITKQELTK